ncbi:MAG: ribokinase [Planctomycetaceae bacterium]|nr:ribokinase [Planctomycetaceae bacterium]
MKILNFGSLNIDFVYAVDHIVQPGETISSHDLKIFCGGKGLNQSIALARAGAPLYHAGMIGPDGDILLDACAENSVDTSLIRRVPERSGNAIIQVGADGQNSIVLFGGANRQNTPEFVDEVLRQFGADDLVLLQNEINHIDRIIDQAAARGMRIALNPAPFDNNLDGCDLGKVSLFIMNEVEGEQISSESTPDTILASMRERYPNAEVVLTLGGDGAVYQGRGETVAQPIFPVKVVDTTAAGDTFTGYFLAASVEGLPPAHCMRLAALASSITVSRQGATPSIPRRTEVEAKL